jgi:hypothetical protein
MVVPAPIVENTEKTMPKSSIAETMPPCTTPLPWVQSSPAWKAATTRPSAASRTTMPRDFARGLGVTGTSRAPVSTIRQMKARSGFSVASIFPPKPDRGPKAPAVLYFFR